MSQTYFASISPGLEDALIEELRELGARKVVATRGGAEFESTYTKVYRILHGCRCATRIWLRVDNFKATNRRELLKKSARTDWSRWLGPDHRLEIQARASRSRLIHTGMIQETVTEAIASRVATKGEIPQLVMARVDDDRCTLSLDLSGDLLFKRGWKKNPVAAPIRETTAACLLRMVNPASSVVDPTCGSGTLVIEAAHLAAGIWPGRFRSFAMDSWTSRPDPIQFAEHATVDRSFLGFDINPEAVQAATANAEAGEVSFCVFNQADIFDLTEIKADPGLLIFNPPYGHRVGETDAPRRMVDHLRKNFPDWKIACVVPAETQLGLPDKACVTSFSNGGIDVKFWLT